MAETDTDLLPEVQSAQLIPRFFKQGDRHYVEISIVGQKDTVVRKVTPAHMAEFRPQWDAYCDGRPAERRSGTALTDIVDEQRAGMLIQRNVHSLEELAALSDQQCQTLGHGTLTNREQARRLLTQRHFETSRKSADKIGKLTGEAKPISSQDVAARAEIAEIKQSVADLAQTVGQLVNALRQAPRAAPKSTGRPRGRPRKVVPETSPPQEEV